MTSIDGVMELAAEILDPVRKHPAVLLTTKPGSPRPTLEPDDVLAIVGPAVPIYLMATGPMTHELEQRLPPKLHAFNGAARIWWPGVGDSSDPHHHPLIQDPYGVYGTKTNSEFERKFLQGPPLVAHQLRDPKAALLERERDSARRALEEERRRSAKLLDDHDRAVSAAASAVRELREERRKASRVAATQAESVAEVDPEHALHRSVLAAWLESSSADDRRRYPLRGYRLHPAFMRSVHAVGELSEGRLAWVCAMVASRRAADLEGLALHELRTGPGGNDPPRIRADGARAMRCALKRTTAAAPRLHYWTCPDGIIEFACIGHHDDLQIPE